MPRRKRPYRETGVSREAWGQLHPLLDLHGLTGDEAVQRAERWLRERQAERAGTVVVVTGRGLHSPGLPVLRMEVQHLLERLRGSVVARFESASQGGSFRVALRAPVVPPARRPAPAPLRDVPAELRRRAEESLAELGITPTEALVAAEIRRLLATDATDADPPAGKPRQV